MQAFFTGYSKIEVQAGCFPRLRLHGAGQIFDRPNIRSAPCKRCLKLLECGYKTKFDVLIDREPISQMFHLRWSLLHINVFCRKKFINHYKYTMLAQYLAFQGANNSRISKRKSDKAVQSPHATKERILCTHMSLESLCILSKIHSAIGIHPQVYS